MLTFDLNQNPPTAEEIGKEHKLATRVFLCAGVVALLSIIGLRWVGFTMTPRHGGVVLELLKDENPVFYAGAAVVFSLFLWGFLSRCLSGLLFGVVAFVFILGLEGLIMTPGMWLDLSATGDSGGAALVSTLVLALIVSVLVAGWGTERNDQLDDIDPADCDQLIADCLADPLCEAYRQKVAALGRKLVEAEVMMIREWVAGADAREKERREGIACALVSSKEPLPSDMDTVANREPTC